MLVVGALVLVGLAAAAALLWAAGDRRRADNVAGFARAPVGCETTLHFSSTGTFQLYAETSGEFEVLAGECDAPRGYHRDPGDVPEPNLTLLDPNGDELALAPAAGDDYDVDGFVGTSIHEVRIDSLGDHVLTVEAIDGEAFAVAIGRSADEGVTLLRTGSIAALIAGIVVGGLLLALGMRRRSVPGPQPEPWSPAQTAWPSSPPGFPVPPATTGAAAPGTASTPPLSPPTLQEPPPTSPVAPAPGSPWAPPGAPPAQ